MKSYPKSRQSNLVVQDFEKEILIYDLQINKAYCLNETSALIWQMCDGKRTVSDIRRKLSEKLKTEIPEDFVWLALDGLKKDNLLEEVQSFEIKFNGSTRREIVKKVGLSSMITLPLIASIIAPSASMAQSGGSAGSLPLFSACTTALQCTSRACSNGVCCLSFGQQTSCTPAAGCADNECCSGMTTTNLFGCASAFSCLCN